MQYLLDDVAVGPATLAAPQSAAVVPDDDCGAEQHPSAGRVSCRYSSPAANSRCCARFKGGL